MYLLIGVLLYLAPKLFGSKLSDKQKALNDLNEAYISELKASLDGYETIYGGNNNQYFINRLNNRNKEYQQSKYDYNYFAEFQQTFLVTLGIFTQVTSYLLGGILIISGGITFGSFITLTNLGNSTYGPLAWIAQKFSIIKSFNVVYDQMGTYYKESEELQKDEVEDIIVEDLSVSYGDETVLEKESIHFEKGKKYLLHGSSGCGKSTLLKAIAGFLESYEGKIIFDNQQFENPDIQIIPQKSNFFEGTIKENILVGRDYDKKKFESIIKLLFIDEFYNDTKKLSFDGFGYSGGQLQRIAIARALYSEPKILIFDEASTGIQKEMADKIIASIVKKDMLFINVSHQYNDDKIALYDDVIDFDQRKNKC